jgi:hypothetical protein
MKYLESDNGCWEFNGCKMPNGYGKVTVKKKTWLAHRYSYFINVGIIPDGMHVCHKCDNRSCINPKHLFLGTRKDNMQDMISKNRHNFSGLRTNNYQEKSKQNTLRGELHPFAKIKEDDVREIRKLYKDGMMQIDIAKLFNVRPGYISNIIRRYIWKSVI